MKEYVSFCENALNTRNCWPWQPWSAYFIYAVQVNSDMCLHLFVRALSSFTAIRTTSCLMFSNIVLPRKCCRKLCLGERYIEI